MKIPSSVFVERVKQVQEIAGNMGLKALVVYSTGSSLGFASRTHGYLRYLCNWDPRNQAAVMVLFPDREKDPVLLVNGRAAKLFAGEIMWFSDIRSIAPDGFGKEIVEILQASGKNGDRIGYIGKAETPVNLFDTLRDRLGGVEWVDADHVINERRVVKDEASIELHRRSASVCDAMFHTFSREVRSGKKVYQLQADLEHTAKMEGCEYASTFMSIGPVVDRARYAKGECSRVPQEGDQVLLSLFVLKDGHWGHAIRTGSIGQLPPKLQETYQIVFEMQEAIKEAIFPGNEVVELWKAGERVLNKYYPEARQQDWYWLKTGHSLGLDYTDPVLSDFFPNPFQSKQEVHLPAKHEEAFGRVLPGMLFEIHPSLFIPGYATAAIGNMLLATESGYEILDRYPRELMAL